MAERIIPIGAAADDDLRTRASDVVNASERRKMTENWQPIARLGDVVHWIAPVNHPYHGQGCLMAFVVRVRPPAYWPPPRRPGDRDFIDLQIYATPLDLDSYMRELRQPIIDPGSGQPRAPRFPALVQTMLAAPFANNPDTDEDCWHTPAECPWSR